MNQGFIEIGVLAFIAGFVLFRLYVTLGRRTGAERPEPRPQPVGAPLSRAEPGLTPQVAPSGPTQGGEGLMAIVRADPNFDVDHFLTGARGAYELIIGAYAKSDVEALRNLLTPRVFESYSAAIAARGKDDPGPELVRLKSAEMTEANLTGSVARVTVKFEAELAEGAVSVRDAREKWTFERDVRSNDPNWRLGRVAAA